MAERAEIVFAGEDRTGPAFASVRRGLGDLDRGITSVRGQLGALAGFASVGLFAGWIKSSIDAADAANDMAEQLGLTVEQLSAYDYAARLSGSSGEVLQKGLVALSNALTTNAKSLEVFQIATGLTLRASDGLAANVNKLAEGFSRMEAGTVKTALAADLLGQKIGPSLLPLFNSGAAGLARFTAEAEKMGRVLSTDTARRAGDLNDNLDRMKGSIEGLGREIAASALPALGQIAEKMAQAARQGGLLRGLLEGLGESVVVATVGPDPTLLEYQRRKVQDLRGEILGLERTLREAASGGEGLLDRLLYGSASDRKERLAAARAELAAAQKLLAQLENPPTPKPRTAGPDPYETQRKREEAAKAAAEAAKKFAAARQKEEEEALAHGKAMSDLELRELERKAEKQERILAEINEKKVEALQLGPTLAARDPAAGFARVQELLAETTRGRGRTIDQDVGALNEELARGTVTAEQYREVFDDIEKRYADLVPEASGLASDLDKQSEAFARLEAAVKGWGSAFNEELVQSLKRRRLEVSKIVDLIATDLARLVIYKNITAPIFGAVGNFFGVPGGAPSPGGTPFAFSFGGGRAMGGPVTGGHWYNVGENGPERLYMPPGASGTIVPNGAGAAPSVGQLIIAPTIAPGASAADVFAATRAAAQLAQSEIARTLRTGAA